MSKLFLGYLGKILVVVIFFNDGVCFFEMALPLLIRWPYVFLSCIIYIVYSVDRRTIF